MTCSCKTSHPSLVEQFILNPMALPPSLREGWRSYRIEYGFECSCPEGFIFLPSHVDPQRIEDILNEQNN